MTDEPTAPASKPPIRFFWWCRECGWWAEVDLGGLCSDCRHHSDRKRRGATPEERDRLRVCRTCLR